MDLLELEQEVFNAFPSLAARLLAGITPGILRPIPAQAIVSLQARDFGGGAEIAKYSRVLSNGGKDSWLTVWETYVSPIYLKEAIVVGNRLLLTINSLKNQNLKHFRIPYIDICYTGNLVEIGKFIVALQAEQDSNLQIFNLGWQGIDEDSDLLWEAGANAGRAAFFRLFGDFALESPECKLSINLNPAWELCNLKDLQINCVPIVNIVKRYAEPIVFDFAQREYQLTVDYQRKMELYKIEDVFWSGEKKVENWILRNLEDDFLIIDTDKPKKDVLKTKVWATNPNVKAEIGQDLDHNLPVKKITLIKMVNFFIPKLSKKDFWQLLELNLKHANDFSDFGILQNLAGLYNLNPAWLRDWKVIEKKSFLFQKLNHFLPGQYLTIKAEGPSLSSTFLLQSFLVYYWQHKRPFNLGLGGEFIFNQQSIYKWQIDW